MDSFSQDMEELLYEYARNNRGCFLGNPKGDFPQCQMVLDCNDSIMVVSPVGLVRSRNWRGRVVSNYMAQAPLRFPQPFHLEIKPKNLIDRGLDMVFKDSVRIKNPAFDKKYCVTTDHPEFVRQLLPSSSLELLLMNTRSFRIIIEPVADERKRHTLQVICLKSFRFDEFLEEGAELEDISMLVDLCRAAHEAFQRYPMVAEGKRGF